MIVDAERARCAAIGGARVRDAALAARDRSPAVACVDRSRPRWSCCAPDAAVATTGAIIVKNDAWCDVTIDGRRAAAARRRSRCGSTLGSHTVVCEPAGHHQDVDEARSRSRAARPSTVEGTHDRRRSRSGSASMRRSTASPHRRGQAVRSSRAAATASRSAGAKTFFDLRVACTVRSSPEPRVLLGTSRGFLESLTSLSRSLPDAAITSLSDPSTCGWQAGCSTT